MDQVVLFTGFATLAGLLLGYLAARRGRGSHMLGLWAVAAAAVFLYPVWLDAGDGPPISNAAAILYVILIPFAVGVVMGSVLGAVMRAIFARGDGA
jgi:hypothetical protein